MSLSATLALTSFWFVRLLLFLLVFVVIAATYQMWFWMLLLFALFSHLCLQHVRRPTVEQTEHQAAGAVWSSNQQLNRQWVGAVLLDNQREACSSGVQHWGHGTAAGTRPKHEETAENTAAELSVVFVIAVSGHHSPSCCAVQLFDAAFCQCSLCERNPCSKVLHVCAGLCIKLEMCVCTCVCVFEY